MGTKMSSNGFNALSTSISSLNSNVSSTNQNPTRTSSHITAVIIGDSSVGKSSLAMSYTINDFPGRHVPTAFDNYSVDVSVGNRLVHFDICDTGGKEQFSSLHGLCIPYSDVILLCFSVVNPQSFHNATTYWLSRARRANPTVPIILVGTQMDLRSDLKTLLKLDAENLKPVTEKEACQRAQQMNAVTYIECSALTDKNVKFLFDNALLTAIKHRNDYQCSNRSSSKSKTDKQRTRKWTRFVSNCIGF